MGQLSQALMWRIYLGTVSRELTFYVPDQMPISKFLTVLAFSLANRAGSFDATFDVKTKRKACIFEAALSGRLFAALARESAASKPINIS